ncbi:MAG: hypothetical protein PHU42_02100 [Patescibacteria group bacterium]|nr:hypothetical protein [Patescibacteria group bacterium]
MRSGTSVVPSLESTSKYLAALGAALNAHNKGFSQEGIVRIDIQALDEAGGHPEEVLVGLVSFLRMMVGPACSLYGKEIFVQSRTPSFRHWIQENVRHPTYAKGLEPMGNIRVWVEPIHGKADIMRQLSEDSEGIETGLMFTDEDPGEDEDPGNPDPEEEEKLPSGVYRTERILRRKK